MSTVSSLSTPVEAVEEAVDAVDQSRRSNQRTASVAAGQRIDVQQIDDLYDQTGQWHLNVGEQKIHSKRMAGRWRRIKWLSSSVWLLFFLGPYLRWDGRQAVLFDLPAQQFHLFGITILPQDLWILALLLLFFAITLALVTALAGRVFCGYFCFQTVWTDVYSAIEAWLEGPPHQRRKLDSAAWGLNKWRIKLTKHVLWLTIALLTGVSFVAWFTDAYQLWGGLIRLSLPIEAWVTIGLFIIGTYSLAGFMREQVCLWLCPYAKIQGVMVDADTLLPVYDELRGEPRGRLQRETVTRGQITREKITPEQTVDEQFTGDCIDCDLCLAVCPTGVDIREGQQSGCITCGLCLDACDSVMNKLGRPLGLIRYDSLNGIEGRGQPRWFLRPRVWTYLLIVLGSLAGIGYGFGQLEALELKLIQQRQPLFVQLSDGSIQNRYRLKILNKTDRALSVAVSVRTPDGLPPKGLRSNVIDRSLPVEASGVSAHDLLIALPASSLRQARGVQPLRVRIDSLDGRLSAERELVVLGPSD